MAYWDWRTTFAVCGVVSAVSAAFALDVRAGFFVLGVVAILLSRGDI